jgi:hypothetical protein
MDVIQTRLTNSVAAWAEVWFQWSAGCILLSFMPRWLSLSLSSTSAPASSLQPISISFLSPSQYHNYMLNHFRIYFFTTKLRKQLYKNLKYDT